METEDHFKQLADRECGRLTLEIKRVEKEVSNTTDYVLMIALKNSLLLFKIIFIGEMKKWTVYDQS